MKEFTTMDKLIQAAYALGESEAIEIRASDLSLLGGPSEETAEGTSNGVTYHCTEDGRSWQTRKAPPADDGEARFFAIPSDHPVTRQTPAIVVLECY